MFSIITMVRSSARGALAGAIREFILTKEDYTMGTLRF